MEGSGGRDGVLAGRRVPVHLFRGGIRLVQHVAAGSDVVFPRRRHLGVPDRGGRDDVRSAAGGVPAGHVADRRRILNCIMEVLSGGLVPVVLLPGVIQKTTYYLPFRLISDLPFRVYTNNIGIYEGLTSIGLQVIWIAVLVFLGNMIVKRSLRKVFVQGG